MTSLRPHNEGRAVASTTTWSHSFHGPAHIRCTVYLPECLNQGSLLGGSMKLQRHDPHQGLKGISQKMRGTYLFVAEFISVHQGEREVALHI